MDAIVPMMMSKGIDMVRENGARTAHLWGLACTDGKPSSGVAKSVIDLASVQLRSPIMDAAEGLRVRLKDRSIWGFGLCCSMVGEFFTGDAGRVPEEVRRAMDGGPLKDRPTADDFCVAMVFDARGWAYCSLKSLHMPELGVTKWQENTLTCADAWAARYYDGVPSAHAWAAAITQNPNRNRWVLDRLRGPGERGAW